MLGKIWGTIKKGVDETEQIDEYFYSKVMDEIANGFRDKALSGKAIAQCDGDEGKFESIYMKLRAKSLQDDYIKRKVS